MISYYKSKHPGLFIYIALVIASVSAFLFADITPRDVGALSILWSLFILVRVLSFYEIGAYFIPFMQVNSPSKNHNASALAHDLKQKMNATANLKRGIFDMNAMHERTMLWFVLALVYVCYHLYSLYYAYTLDMLLQNICVFFMIGAAFWCGQTYSNSKSASTLLIGVFCGLFMLALYKVSNGFSFDYTDTFLRSFTYYYDNSALPLLAALIGYSVVILVHSCFYGGQYRMNALMGLCVLSLLILCGLTFTPGTEMVAFWISGWSLFSVFWMKSYCQSYRRYALYQCE